MLPLATRRILITRARGQASALATKLEELGATTILIPTIELAPPGSYVALDAALTNLRGFDWLVFTSANAVRAFVSRARELRLQPQARRIAVIGPATAKEVTDAGLQVHLMPPLATAESLAETLAQRMRGCVSGVRIRIPAYASGAKILLVRAAVARDILPESLIAAGATVTIAEAYRTILPQDSIDELRTLFTTQPPDAITFTSASTAQNLVALLESAALPLPAQTILASIGPITSHAMRQLVLEPTVEAAEASISSLVDALVAHFSTLPAPRLLR